MKVYAGMDPRLRLADVPAYARRVEALGFDGLHIAETVHDSLMVAAIVAEHTERITIRTAVTLAFVRSPTLVAYAGWDLAQLSGGRFELGLGTQIRQNIEGRFGMSWSEPITRMRDYIGALRALFDAFGTGGSVDYDSASYRIDRLQPYFNPGADGTTGPPTIWLGAVNPRMCQLAAEVADGLVTHPTNSDAGFLRHAVVPNTGRLPIVAALTLATGMTDNDVATERERQRRLLAFLYSTPAYAAALEARDRADLPARLRALIRNDEWETLGSVLDDALLDDLIVAGRYEQLSDLVAERYGGLVHGVSIPSLAHRDDDGRITGFIREVQAGSR